MFALYLVPRDLVETLNLVSTSMENLASVNISSMGAVVETVTDLDLCKIVKQTVTLSRL